MKFIASFLLLTVCQLCFAVEGTNIIALSAWSKPVYSPGGQALRARMMIAQEHSPAHAGPWPETEFYLELQNVSGAIGAPLQIYFDPASGLKCQMLDANGNPPPRPRMGSGGSGGGAGAVWITLPYDSMIRLRANMFGYGLPKGEGLKLTLRPGVEFLIENGDTNDYYFSGTFSVRTPTNFVPKDSETARSVWTGILELPKMKISVSRP